MIFIILLYAILPIPDSMPEIIQDIDKSAFAWNKDQYWSELESRFIDVKQFGCVNLRDSINTDLNEFNALKKP